MNQIISYIFRLIGIGKRNDIIDNIRKMDRSKRDSNG